MTDQVIPDAAVTAYLNAHFRPEQAADLLAAAQPLMAIAWDEGFAEGWDCEGAAGNNPYRGARKSLKQRAMDRYDKARENLAELVDNPQRWNSVELYEAAVAHAQRDVSIAHKAWTGIK